MLHYTFSLHFTPYYRFLWYRLFWITEKTALFHCFWFAAHFQRWRFLSLSFQSVEEGTYHSSRFETCFRWEWTPAIGLYFSKALKKNAYQDLLAVFLSLAKKHYDEGDISRNFLAKYLEFLNKNCLTELRNNQLFISLRRELGISSDEDEKCAFWDSFNEAGDILSKAAFVETGIVQACCTGNEIDGYLDNLSTLFTSTMLESPFAFFLTWW